MTTTTTIITEHELSSKEKLFGLYKIYQQYMLTCNAKCRYIDFNDWLEVNNFDFYTKEEYKNESIS